jgi:polyisoprenoid-binding protein YceI
VASGTLTIRGVAQPLSLPFQLTIADGVGRATGTASVARLPFGIGRSNDPKGEFLPEAIDVSVAITAAAPAALAGR